VTRKRLSTGQSAFPFEKPDLKGNPQMALLYKPIYTKDSPEYLRALDYLNLTSGGALANPTVSDLIVFAGPEGSYEDIQIQFSAPAAPPPFRQVQQAQTGFAPITQRETQYQASIDLLVQYPNVVLVELSTWNSPYQWFVLTTPLNPFAPVLHQLAIVTPPAPASDGNLWLGPKQTNVGEPDQIGDRRYSAPTDTAVPGMTTQFHGLTWKKVEYTTLFTTGKQVWWQAIAAA
jgi:hypothetical protein